MASAVGHFLVGAALASPLAGPIAKDTSLHPLTVVAGAGLLALAPDLDVITLKFVPYAHTFGHRGFFHSPFFLLLFTFLLCLLLFVGIKSLTRAKAAALFTIFSLATLTHPTLDAMTSAGLGVMLYYPWDLERHFLSWRPFVAPPFQLSAITAAHVKRMATTELPVVSASLLTGIAMRFVIFSFRPKTSRIHP